MGKIYTDVIDAYYKGKSADQRLQEPESFFISSGFDIWSNPKRITPFRSFESDEDQSMMMVAFQYINGILNGLGLKSGTSKAKISYSSGGPTGGTWTAWANGEAASGGDSRKVFLSFHNYLYGLALDVGVWAFGDVTSSPTFTTTAKALTGGACAQGIITSDDLMLIPYDYKIAKKDGAGSGPTDSATWTAAALILPSDRLITDLVEVDANTVAVATRPVLGVGNSIVYLWDKVNTDPYDAIDWGEGSLILLDMLETELIGVTQVGGSGVNANVIQPRLIIKTWSGGKARVVQEVKCDDGTFTVYGNHTKVRDGNRIHFGIQIKLDSVTYLQLAAIGRKTDQYPLAFSMAQLVDNDTPITSMQGVGKVGDYFFVAHNADGSVNRTNDNDLYTTCTAIYISQKINGGHISKDLIRKFKKLLMCGIVCPALPTDATISLYVRRDGETSWTLVRSYSTANGMGFEAGVKNDQTDFGAAKEFQFKVTTVGAAIGAKGEMVALPYSFEDVGADIASS